MRCRYRAHVKVVVGEATRRWREGESGYDISQRGGGHTLRGSRKAASSPTLENVIGDKARPDTW